MRTVEAIKADIAELEHELHEGYVNTDWCELQLELKYNLISDISPNELETLCTAYKDGRVVVLPCWGTVFIIKDGVIQEMQMCHYGGNDDGVYHMRCECIDQHDDCDDFCNDKACAYQFKIHEIGKTVFLTKEQAEAALAAKGDFVEANKMVNK